MKSRTSISFCQRPERNPRHADSALFRGVSVVTVALTESSPFLCPSDVGFDQSKQYACVAGNHQFLVSRNHPRRHLTVARGDPGSVAVIRLGIEFDTEPCGRLADSLADFIGVFSNSGRKDDSV